MGVLRTPRGGGLIPDDRRTQHDVAKETAFAARRLIVREGQDIRRSRTTAKPLIEPGPLAFPYDPYAKRHRATCVRERRPAPTYPVLARRHAVARACEHQIEL